VRFATSGAAQWAGNFRELAASVSRLATLADGGRITEALVRDEIERLRAAWSPSDEDELAGLLPADKLQAVDPFDRMQLDWSSVRATPE
jgi:transcriptional regulatory protein RtcR